MPERELQICSRLRVFREATKLTRTAFAREIGMDAVRYASYELGRAPVRFDLAWRVKEKFHLSLVWLFKEAGNMRGNFAIPARCVPTPGMLFSKAYEFYLGQSLIDSRAGQRELPFDEILAATATKGSKLSDLELDAIFERKKEVIPKRIWLTVRSSMDDCAEQAVGYLRKGVLTDAEGSSKTVPAMKLQLPGLLERLREATAAPGKKTELAAALKPKVPLESVSRWLSGAREPGGEIALQLDAWATLQGFPKAK